MSSVRQGSAGAKPNRAICQACQKKTVTSAHKKQKQQRPRCHAERQRAEDDRQSHYVLAIVAVSWIS